MKNDDDDMLPKVEQQDIAELAQPDPTRNESKWTIYKNLPSNRKWPYFYRHFFWPIIAAVVVLALIVIFIVNAVTTPKGQGLGVAYLEMKQSTSQMNELQDGFVNDRHVDPKLVSMQNQFYIDSNNKLSAHDSDATLETEISGGTINTMIGAPKIIEQQNKNGFVEPLKNVVSESELKELQNKGAVVELPEGGDGAKVPAALDLSKSKVWTTIDGNSSAAQVAFVNVSDMQYVHDFVRYLYGL